MVVQFMNSTRVSSGGCKGAAASVHLLRGGDHFPILTQALETLAVASGALLSPPRDDFFLAPLSPFSLALQALVA